MKTLRLWQRECIDAALHRFEKAPHFCSQATPGAGKSRMAAETAKALISKGLVDFVLCFGPSSQIVSGLAKTFSEVLGRRFDGRIGAIGDALTYQAMEYQTDSFWKLLSEYRVFAIFDEIHHCAGRDLSQGNAWGQTIIQRIQDQAAFTLALSGTPWRSDEQAITLARYSDPEGRLICDYQYGLRESVSDGVCRSPRITLMEINAVRLKKANNSYSMYSSIAELLNNSPVTFEDLVSHDEVMREVLKHGCERLKNILPDDPNAGGLVVATNIHHAYQIAAILRRMGEECRVVTNRTPGAQEIINAFRNGDGRWIVAVGMISEGTDVPRLRVCCHLSRIRTELHYRQVLGRVLRRTGNTDDHAWLIVLADPSLHCFSHRVASDLPDDLAVIDICASTEVEQIDLNIATDPNSIIELHHEALRDTERTNPTSLLIATSNINDELHKMELISGLRTEILSLYQ